MRLEEDWREADGGGGARSAGAGTAAVAAATAPGAAWRPVCTLEDILPATGVCALLDGRQVAVVRPGDSDEVYAIDNFDPFSKAYVLSRGIVGDRAGVPKIASPVFKQSFDLRTGQCLDDPAVKLAVYPARVGAGGVVEVAMAMSVSA